MVLGCSAQPRAQSTVESYSVSRSSTLPMAVAASTGSPTGVDRAVVTASRAAITMARTVPTPPFGRSMSEVMVSSARSDQVAYCAP